VVHLEQISLPWPKRLPVKLAAVLTVLFVENGEGDGFGLRETISRENIFF